MDTATAQTLARLDRRLEPLLEPEMRRGLVREWLGEADPEAACEVVAAALARRRSADSLRRALSEVLTGITGKRLDYELQCDLYAAASRKQNDEVMRLLRSVPAREALEDPERLLSKELAEMQTKELNNGRLAMIAIAGEIAEIESGAIAHDDSALAHAPHTAEDLLVADWERPYTREQAAYPVDGLRRDKYWPPVSRIDGAAGDRNLVCACPPPEAFEDADS